MPREDGQRTQIEAEEDDRAGGRALCLIFCGGDVQSLVGKKWKSSWAREK